MSAPAAPAPATEHKQQRFKSPPGSTDIILVRHGASAAFVPGKPFPLVNGQGDPPLADPEGLEHAWLVGERLKTEPIRAIYATNLTRTRQTMEPLAKLLGLEIVEEADLREVHLGDWEGGLFRAKAAARDPAFVKAIEEGEWGHIPGAETSAQLLERCRRGILRIHEKHKGEMVAVCVHGGVIGVLLAHAVGARNAWTFTGADNGSCHHLVVKSENEWILRCYNDTTHLGGGFTGAAQALT
ncbi:phosphoglycerate mutase [Hyaloraphidium curvatum]|nr:phosphoglycerate mutase [Hyaloraphidium curvatum]